MAFLRLKQPAIVNINPHDGNRRWLIPNIFGRGVGPEPPPVLLANWVSNNATGIMETTTGTLEALAASDDFLLSMWFKSDLPDETSYFFNAGTGNSNNNEGRTSLRLQNEYQLVLGNLLNNDIGVSNGSQTYNSQDRNHFLVSRLGNVLQVYINDNQQFVNNITAATQPFNLCDTVQIGARVNGVAPGQFAEVYYYAGEYLDIDIEAERRKFISNTGQPVSLGANGELPIGKVPDVYLGGSMLAADWNAGTNLGQMTGFAVRGGPFTDVV